MGGLTGGLNVKGRYYFIVLDGWGDGVPISPPVGSLGRSATPTPSTPRVLMEHAPRCHPCAYQFLLHIYKYICNE
jgi:hypothetical protein